MKTFILLLFSSILQVSAVSFAQKITLDKDSAPLESVLKELRKQSGYDFLYNNKLLKNAIPVTIHVKEIAIDEALRICFAGQPIIYKIEDKAVWLKQKDKSKSVTTSAIQFDEILTGRIVDEQGKPLPGVSIIEKGTKNAIQTNSDGEFTIRNISQGSTLVFSAIGYQTREIKFTGQKSISLTLSALTNQLDELVVVGYGTTKKADLTGAVSSFKPTQQQAATSVSFDQMLQGKVSGVRISNTVAEPGAALSVIIRGANSLRGDNQPLYVVDNVPLPSTAGQATSAFGGTDIQTPINPLTSINPGDIESIEVLKDASATAIYGSRGANGVIIITTKKGKTGKAVINLGANTSFSDVKKKKNVLGLSDYVDFLQAQKYQNFFRVNDEIRYVATENLALYNPEDPLTYGVIRGEKDWQNELYKTGYSQNYNLSVSGGSEAAKYYISGGYQNQQGIIDNTGLKIGNLASNLNLNISPKILLNLNLSASLRRNNMSQGTNVTTGQSDNSIVRSALSAAPFIVPVPENFDATNTEHFTVSDWLKDYDDITNANAFRGSLNGIYKISKNFSYELRLSGNKSRLNRARWYGLAVYTGSINNGSLGITSLDNSNYTIENLLRFNTRLGNKVKVEGFIGASYDDYNSLNTISNGTNFDIFTLRTKGLPYAKNQSNGAIQANYQIASFLSRTNFDFFNGRYLATINFRSDGSSKFSKNKWGYFPSFALAWKINQEEFLKNASYLNLFKLRVGYGITGNQSIAPYATISDFSSSADNSASNGNGNFLLAVSSNRIANKDLTWETTKSLDLGLDYAFLNNRISGSIDAYRKNTSNLLLLKDIPLSTGFANMPVNNGEIRNQGIEFDIQATAVKSGDFQLALNANISFNRNKVINIAQPRTQQGVYNFAAIKGNGLGSSFYKDPANIFAEGYQTGLFWGYQTGGIIKDIAEVSYTDASGNTKLVDYSAVLPGGAKVGGVKFLDLNGDKKIDANDQTFIGNPNPDFTYGFGLNFQYRSVSLRADFYGSKGNNILNANSYFEAASIGRGNILKNVYDNLWSGLNPNGTFPAIGSPNIAVVTDRIIEDASFLRMSDITLSYQFAKTFLKKLGLSNLTINLTGKNLLLITNYSGYDPEYTAFSFDALRQGIDWNGFAPQKSFIAGLSANF